MLQASALASDTGTRHVGPGAGTLTKSGKLRGLLLWGVTGAGKLGGGGRGAQAPFRAVGPAPGAQRGRTAATQVVYVHIPFITFIENRKPHT